MKKSMAASIISFILITLFPFMRVSAYENVTEQLVSEFQKETKCKNVSVAVFNNGETIFYGDSKTLYQIGSMTKAFTGLAIQKLITEGKISENDIISDHIPGFEAFYGPSKVTISIQDLVEQKSGFTNSEKDYPSADENMTLEEWADSISGKELKSLPGTEYAYSNVNYNLLGLIIEETTGMTYKDYMEKEMLIPLGLANTFVGEPADGNVTEGSRLGYRNAFRYSVPVREASIPAGYFYSDSEDMARWIGIWTGSIEIPEEFSQAIENTKKQLGKTGDYAYGWELFEGDVIGHSGGTPNYSSRIVFSEKDGIGAVVLCNMNVAASTDSLCNNIFDSFKGNEKKSIARDVWTVFDHIFTIVSIAGLLVFVAVLFIKKRVILIVTDALIILLFALIMILFPIIFQADLKDILFTWAPWSLTGALMIMAVDIFEASIRILSVKKHASDNKTG